MTLAKEVMGGGLSAGQANGLGGNYAAITAAGSSKTDATLIGASSVVVASADGSKGVILPAGQVGDEVDVFNNAGSTLKVYPPAGAAITVVGTGLGSADTAFSLLTYKTATFKCVTTTQWFVNVSA